MASTGLSDIESKINEVRDRLANLSLSINSGGPLALSPSADTVAGEPAPILLERDINESSEFAKPTGGLSRLVELAKREADSRHGEQKQQQQQVVVEEEESQRNGNNVSIGTQSEVNRSQAHVYYDPEPAALTLPPRSHTATLRARGSVVESAKPAARPLTVSESNFDPFKAVQARLREKFMRNAMSLSPPSSPERDDASDSPSPKCEPQTFQKRGGQREHHDAKHSQQRSFYDAKHSQQQSPSDAKYSRHQSLSDAKRSRQQSLSDATRSRQQSLNNAKYSQQQSPHDAKQSRQQSLSDAKHSRQQSLNNAKYSQQQSPYDAKPSRQPSLSDAKYSRQRDGSRSRPLPAERAGSAARRPSVSRGSRSGSPCSAAQPALPARTAAHRTVLDVLSGAEVFALMRLRGVLVSRGDTGEEALPDTHCHSVYLSPDEHRQLLDLRASVRGAAAPKRKATDALGKPATQQRRRAPLWA